MPSIISQTRTGLRYFFTERLMAGFAGGLNLRDAPTELKSNESPNAWNVTLDERGGVVKRLGFTKWNTPTSEGPVDGGFQLLLPPIEAPADAPSGVDVFQDSYYSLLLDLLFWYSPGNGKLYSDTDGTLTNVATFTPGYRVSLVDFAGKIYLAHEHDGLHQSNDGATWTTTVKGAHATDIPQGELIAVWQNKLWIASRSSNNLFFSAPGDATNWDSADGGGNVNIREKDDAPIVALHGGSGIDFQTEPGLFVFKRDSIYRVVDSTTGAYLAIDGSVGAASKNSVTSLYGELIFISRRGIYQTKKLASVVPVAEQILPLFDPVSTDDTKLDNFCAGYLGDRVYFSITLQGSFSSVNNLALEYAPLYGWVVTGSNAMGCYQTKTGDAAEFILGASPLSTGQVYRLFDGGADDGEDIVSWYETRWFEESNGHQARLQQARCLFRGSNVTVSSYVDFSNNANWSDTLDSTSGGMTWGTGVWGTDEWGGFSQEEYSTLHPRVIGRAFKIRIDETSSATYSRPALLGSGASLPTGAWALYAIETQYGPLGLS